jgi:hypothetical protein
MNILCPSCKLENKIENGEHILCGGCQKPFTGHTYKKYKKPLLSATTALLLGIFGGYKADQWLLDNARYPLETEYALMDSCINSSNIIASYMQRAKKQEICSCALTNTMNDISYSELSENEKIFASRFRANAQICS